MNRDRRSQVTMTPRYLICRGKGGSRDFWHRDRKCWTRDHASCPRLSLAETEAARADAKLHSSPWCTPWVGEVNTKLDRRSSTVFRVTPMRAVRRAA